MFLHLLLIFRVFFFFTKILVFLSIKMVERSNFERGQIISALIAGASVKKITE